MEFSDDDLAVMLSLSSPFAVGEAKKPLRYGGSENDVAFNSYVSKMPHGGIKVVDTFLSIGTPDIFFCGVNYKGDFSREWSRDCRFDLDSFVTAIETGAYMLKAFGEDYFVGGVDTAGLVVHCGRRVPLWSFDKLEDIVLTLYDHSGKTLVSIRHGNGTRFDLSTFPHVSMSDRGVPVALVGSNVIDAQEVSVSDKVDQLSVSVLEKVLSSGKAVVDREFADARLAGSCLDNLLSVGINAGVLEKVDDVWRVRTGRVLSEVRKWQYDTFVTWFDYVKRNGLVSSFALLNLYRGRPNLRTVLDVDRAWRLPLSSASPARFLVVRNGMMTDGGWFSYGKHARHSLYGSWPKGPPVQYLPRRVRLSISSHELYILQYSLVRVFNWSVVNRHKYSADVGWPLECALAVGDLPIKNYGRVVMTLCCKSEVSPVGKLILEFLHQNGPVSFAALCAVIGIPESTSLEVEYLRKVGLVAKHDEWRKIDIVELRPWLIEVRGGQYYGAMVDGVLVMNDDGVK